MNPLPVFKAYDLRGIVPSQLNPALAYHLGRALKTTQPDLTSVILGMDSRLSSATLLNALAAGLQSVGVQVQSLGLCGTEEVYHAAGTDHADLGIIITASHNPAEYNGMKFVKRGGQPFSPVPDLANLEAATRAALATEPNPTIPMVTVPTLNLRAAYVQHILGLINPASIPAQTIVINAGNGAAGPTADAILAHLPQLTAIRVHHQPDGTFPNGIPNPLLPHNRASTSQAVVANQASLGVAWDGDFDRCFLFDEHGQFVSNYYLAGLLTEAILQQYPGSTIVHDPRLYWDTVATITKLGGQAVIAKVGHGYIKPAMRAHNAPFAGEISGHFYFREFFTCDSGMLPWLLVLQLLGQRGQTLAQAVAQRQAAHPASDEINFTTPQPAKEYLAQLNTPLRALGGHIEEVDGLSIGTPSWRANVRASSNEPLLRLNVEATNATTLQQQLQQLEALITSHGATLADH